MASGKKTVHLLKMEIILLFIILYHKYQFYIHLYVTNTVSRKVSIKLIDGFI